MEDACPLPLKDQHQGEADRRVQCQNAGDEGRQARAGTKVAGGDKHAGAKVQAAPHKQAEVVGRATTAQLVAEGTRGKIGDRAVAGGKDQHGQQEPQVSPLPAHSEPGQRQ